MENYKISVGIDPTNEYEKAKKDLIQALESVQSLPAAQQRKLAEEMLGAAYFASFCQIFGCPFR